jgi:hypothetical protein
MNPETLQVLTPEQVADVIAALIPIQFGAALALLLLFWLSDLFFGWVVLHLGLSKYRLRNATLLNEKDVMATAWAIDQRKFVDSYSMRQRLGRLKQFLEEYEAEQAKGVKS